MAEETKYFSDGELALLTIRPDKSLTLEEKVIIHNLDEPITDPEKIEFYKKLVERGAAVYLPKERSQFKTATTDVTHVAGQGANLEMSQQASMTPEEIDEEKNRRAIESLRAVIKTMIKAYLELAKVPPEEIPGKISGGKTLLRPIDSARAAQLSQQIRTKSNYIIVEIP